MLSKSNATQRNTKFYQLSLKMNVSLPSSLPGLTMASCADLGQKQLGAKGSVCTEDSLWLAWGTAAQGETSLGSDWDKAGGLSRYPVGSEPSRQPAT